MKKRGYFWKDRFGQELSFKQFMKRWKKGIVGITPLQQTKTSLWGYPFIFGGIFWGIVISIVSATYWLALILFGSLPITTMQLVSHYRKYIKQKEVYNTMKKLNEEEEKKK